MPNLRKEILDKVRKYYASEFPRRNFTAGDTYIPYSGRVFDESELVNLAALS